MINQLFVRMAGFFVCSGGTAACGEEDAKEEEPRQRRGLRRKSDGCDTAKQRKKSHAGGEAYGEARPRTKGATYGKGNLRGDKGGKENGEDGKGLYCWDAP